MSKPFRIGGASSRPERVWAGGPPAAVTGSRDPRGLPMAWGIAPPEAGVLTMANETNESPAMRMGACPYCERTVLVYEDPPRCPICACPLDVSTMRPFVFPSEPVGEAEAD